MLARPRAAVPPPASAQKRESRWNRRPQGDARPRPSWPLLAAVSLTTVGILPVLMTGALTTFVAVDLRLSTAEIGLAVGLFFASSAVASVPAGRLVAKAGSYASSWCAGGLSALALLAIGLVVGDQVTLLGAMVIGGVGNAAGQLASNLLISETIEPRQQGFAFGLKQAAIPLGAFLGGVAVPVLALGVGWRWAFVIGPIFLVLWAISAPRTHTTPQRRPVARDSLSSRRSLAVLALAAGLAAGSATALTTFLVAWAITIGMSPAVAGVLLAVASAAAIASRLLAGWGADRTSWAPMRVVALMMLAGGFALGLLSLGRSEFVILGGIVGLGAGWGWNGLLHYAVVRANPNSPAQATGITQVGVYLGGVTGPIVAGVLIDVWSFQAVWAVLGLAMAVAAGLVHVARPRAHVGQ